MNWTKRLNHAINVDRLAREEMPGVTLAGVHFKLALHYTYTVLTLL